MAVASAVCGPSARSAAGVRLQLPVALVVAVPSTLPSSVTVTVLSGSAVPEMTGRLLPSTESFTGVVITGAAGGVVSTVKRFVLERSLVLPRTLVAVALTLYGPSASSAGTVKVHAPEASAVVVPTCCVPR